MSVDVAAPEGGRKPANVDLNLVPFIDMMSCLVAFLLITAVWTNVAQVDVRGGGRGSEPADTPPRSVSLLVADDALWLGSSDGALTRLAAREGGPDFDALPAALSGLGVAGIEVAADDHVEYGQLIAAIDDAAGAGYAVEVMSAAELSVKFRR